MPMGCYLLILVLFGLPLAVQFFATEFFPGHPVTEQIEWIGITSPFAASFAVPLDMDYTGTDETLVHEGNWLIFITYMTVTASLNGMLLAAMVWLFNVRWRVTA